MSVDFERAQAIFLDAVELDTPGQRRTFLDEASDGDVELREHVEILLEAHGQSGAFLECGALVIDPTIDQRTLEKPGALIGRYKLREQIGEGGFGTVYVAEQQEPVARKVALKVIKPGMDSRAVVARFESERQALALMDHPNIATVLDAGATENGRPYFVMELVKGTSITEFCDSHKLGTRERLELFVEVCRAVQHAHQKGIIHRDLKPSNVMVTMRDDRAIPKVIDFGVAKALSQKLTERTVYTGYGQLVGTPLYMSPEQAQMNEVDVDTRSDVYSLGILLYELLTGTTPFDGDAIKRANFDELRRMMREDEPPRPSDRVSTLRAKQISTISDQREIDAGSLIRSLRGELDWIVMRALEKDRNRRYESASEFAADVERFLNDEPVQARPPSTWYRFCKFARRKKGTFAAAAVLCLALMIVVGTIAGSLGWIVRDRDAREARLAEQVALILGDVEHLMQEQEWPESLASAERAAATVEGGDADEATLQRVRAIVKDLRFVDRLERIRMQAASLSGGQFDYGGADSEYADAFVEYGVDVDRLPEEMSVEQLSLKRALAVPVAAALDDWSHRRRRVSEDDLGWKRLIAIARGIDPDPLRNGLRNSWEQPTTPETKADLRRLAQSMDVYRQHPSTLLSVSFSLSRTKQREVNVRFLRRAQAAFPDDFWLNFVLAENYRKGEDHAGAVRFWTAAVAVRPSSSAAHNNLGRALLIQNELGEAIACFRKAIKLDPEAALFRFNLATALYGKGKWEQVIATCKTAIELDPKNAATHRMLGDAYHRQGDLDKAIAWLRKSLELDATSALTHRDLGVVLSRQRNLDEAIANYRKSVELDPNSAFTTRLLGIALSLQGKLDEAVVHYRRAIELDPMDAAAHRVLGIALRDQGKLDEAITCFRKSLEIESNNALTYRQLGIALSQQRNLGEAVVAYRKAIELHSKDAVTHRNLANALDGLGKTDEAIASFHKAIELNPSDAVAHCNLGSALNSLGKTDQAIASFHKAIEVDPKFAMAHANLGGVLHNQRKLDEAIASYKRAIELDPLDAFTHNVLGDALARQNHLDEAVACFRNAIQLELKEPRDHGNLTSAHCNLAWCLANAADPRFRDSKQAIFHAERAVEFNSKSSIAWQVLGWSRYRAGDWSGSIAALQKSIQLQNNRDDRRQSFCLAMAHWQLGQRLESRQWYDKAVDWMKANRLDEEPELLRFRAEAEELLGLRKEETKQKAVESNREATPANAQATDADDSG